MTMVLIMVLLMVTMKWQLEPHIMWHLLAGRKTLAKRELHINWHRFGSGNSQLAATWHSLDILPSQLPVA